MSVEMFIDVEEQSHKQTMDERERQRRDREIPSVKEQKNLW